MWVLTDHEGRSVRVTMERLDHLQEHPEMQDLETEVQETIRSPQVVIAARDPGVRRYYRLIQATRVGAKLLCVVVEVGEVDAFLLTAYLTDSIKRGAQLWPRRT